MNSNIVKVVVPLVIDDDGFPPIASETMNAQSHKGQLIIENTPFFATGIALGDCVEAEPIHNRTNYYAYTRVTVQSGNKALSIIFLDTTIKESTYKALKEHGCYCELGEFGRNHELIMLAVSVPVNQDYALIAEYLNNLERLDLLSYAELAI